MELSFTKQGNVYVAEATVNSDYALHIERQGHGKCPLSGRKRFDMVAAD